MRFDGRVALVTGAGSGIGEEVARRLGEEGATVVGLDVHPGDQVTIVCDVSNEDEVAATVGSAVANQGRIDILCNIAGIGAVGDILDNSLDEWHRVFEVNLFGLVHVTRAVLPSMRARRAGVIVNVSSVVALKGFPDRALYTATKGATSALSRAIAADYVGEGIRVNVVSPGTVDTPWVGRLVSAASDMVDARRRLEVRQPLGRLAMASEIAAAILFLASDDAAFATAVEWVVDGGISGIAVRPT